MYVPFSVFSVLFVCKCVLFYCHRVSTQLQLNIYHIIKSSLITIEQELWTLYVKTYVHLFQYLAEFFIEGVIFQ
jgi:hypothetical protein